jgi:hypothetical protein
VRDLPVTSFAASSGVGVGVRFPVFGYVTGGGRPGVGNAGPTLLDRVAVPFFSCASRACRAATVLVPTCPAMTATVMPAVSPTARPQRPLPGCRLPVRFGRGVRGRRGVGGAAGRGGGRIPGTCYDGDPVSLSPALFRFLISRVGVSRRRLLWSAPLS